MIFDRLCAIVERVYRNEALMQLLKQARIFEFPGRLHEVAKGRSWESVGGCEFLLDHFFLPFPVVAIEDSASCVVIADDHPDQKGLDVSRTFIECMDLSTPLEEFGRSASDPIVQARYAQSRETTPGSCCVTISQLTRCRVASPEELRRQASGGTGLQFEGVAGMTFVANKTEMLVNPESARRAMLRTGQTVHTNQAALINATAALEEIMFFNTPDRFVVERSPETVRKPGAKGLPALRRSVERPHYILLRPEEIRERLGLSNEDRRTPTPHARRRHYRTLRSDRFTNKAGQVVVVKAAWVGPTEGEFKGRTYRVCLDL